MHPCLPATRPTLCRSAAIAALSVAILIAARAWVAPAAVTAAAGTVVSGTVGGTDQGFLTGASAVIDGPVHRDARTDADGRFTLTDVPRGRYRLEAAAEGYLPLDRDLDVYDASVSIDILLLRIPQVP